MRWARCSRRASSAGARACIQSARISSARGVTVVARRTLGGIVRWAISPRGAGSAGARADLCCADTVLRVGRRRRLVLRTGALGTPCKTCAVAQVRASCA